MNREIREDVCSGLHGLHEMILRLSDSRNRYIADKEKMRASYERRLIQTEAKHAAALRSLSETTQATQKEILDAIKGHTGKPKPRDTSFSISSRASRRT
ncbi:jg26939 [Pararge aegeria aegeria]|uniref:Jg26939 protein n=1 Tax=Pararge aegeria aegeria TaxID=348720 RepID=A0A8S4QQ88_9NEOP|nr:jg26939 [Pararge aegeria aegeria]